MYALALPTKVYFKPYQDIPSSRFTSRWPASLLRLARKIRLRTGLWILPAGVALSVRPVTQNEFDADSWTRLRRNERFFSCVNIRGTLENLVIALPVAQLCGVGVINVRGWRSDWTGEDSVDQIRKLYFYARKFL